MLTQGREQRLWAGPKCEGCGKYLPGYSNYKYCSHCHSILSQLKREARIEGIKDNNPNSGPNVGLIVVLKRRLASALRREFRRHPQKEKSNLTMSYLIKLYDKQKGCCAISGRSLSLGSIKLNEYTSDTISVDRIDSSKGYMQGNVQLVTFQINLAKHIWSTEKLISLCEDVVNQSRLQVESSEDVKD